MRSEQTYYNPTPLEYSIVSAVASRKFTNDRIFCFTQRDGTIKVEFLIFKLGGFRHLCAGGFSLARKVNLKFGFASR
jgi:hypothetical protein